MRQLSFASLAGIVLAAFLITFIYRQMAVNGITSLGGKINVELAHTALGPVKAKLLQYLASVDEIEQSGEVIPPINVDLTKDIRDVMQDTAVIRIKIFNRHGIVVFSTNPAEIGNSQLEYGDRYENKGFQSAIRGKEANKLVYVDAFNLFASKSKEQNLMQTYIPLRRSVVAPVQGVFEIFTDAQPLVDYAQFTQFAVAGVTALIMALLYLTILMIVRRAEKIIDSQQSTIRDRTETLELLSAQLLTAQERERARLAEALHEDIAQTLSAIQLQIERATRLTDREQANEYPRSMEVVTSAVQDAIRKVQAMAMELRPPSLDDLGVVATLNWYLREYQSHHPEIHLESDISVGEGDVSRSIKVILYRIVQEMLDNLARYAIPSLVRVSLTRTNKSLVLTVEDSGMLYQPGKTVSHHRDEERIWLHAIEERAVLSGGKVAIETKAPDGYRVDFIWEI